jgi:hypothetical protein
MLKVEMKLFSLIDPGGKFSRLLSVRTPSKQGNKPRKGSRLSEGRGCLEHIKTLASM